MNFGMLLHKSKGILKYGPAKDIGNPGFKIILEVDPGIVSFCRAIMPKYIDLNPQRYAPHISVVRNEHCVNMEFWGRYEGEEVEFEYTNYIHHGKVYWWINAFSTRLEEIRTELGLYIDDKYTKPPEGYKKCFHITLGNVKEA